MNIKYFCTYAKVMLTWLHPPLQTLDLVWHLTILLCMKTNRLNHLYTCSSRLHNKNPDLMQGE